MLENVLVVLDGRSLSERIVGRVRRLCRRSAGRVHLLVVRDPERTVWAGARPVAFASQLEESTRLEALTYLEGGAARLERAGVPVATEVRFGAPVEAVLAAARDSSATLVALATPGGVGGSDPLGRLARELLRRAPVPVLIARARDQRAA